MTNPLAEALKSDFAAVTKTVKKALKPLKDSARDHLAKSKLKIALIGQLEKQRKVFVAQRNAQLAIAQAQWPQAQAKFAELEKAAPETVFDRKRELAGLIEAHKTTLTLLQKFADESVKLDIKIGNAAHDAIRDLQAAKKKYAKECDGKKKVEKQIAVCGTKNTLDINLVDGEIASLQNYRLRLDKRSKVYMDTYKILQGHLASVAALLAQVKKARVT